MNLAAITPFLKAAALIALKIGLRVILVKYCPKERKHNEEK
jgi:hypothetical protein